MTSPFDSRPSDAVRHGINRRAEGYLRDAVERVYAEHLLRWAREDDYPFPDRGGIRARLEAELLVLCSGLGTWAAAPPAQFFDGIDRRIRQAEESQRWGWGE